MTRKVVQVSAEHGFDGMAQVMELLFNECMKIERQLALGVGPYQRGEARQGQANGFKPRRLKTRIGPLALSVREMGDPATGPITEFRHSAGFRFLFFVTVRGKLCTTWTCGNVLRNFRACDCWVCATMKIVCTSDLHGHLPSIEPCDLLLIAGDICPAHNHARPFQRQWLADTFAPWLKTTPAAQRVMVWGNHDWIAEQAPHMLPSLSATVLTDQLHEWNGLRIYGLPWQRRFMDWAFNLDTPELDSKYAAVPSCEIIVSHGPPYGYGDFSPYEQEHCGSRAFVEAIDRVQPKLVVFGHIHEGAGRWQRASTTLLNASQMDEKYRPVHAPAIIEW